MPAGRVLGVIVIALLVAALFNSEAIVRAGESMQARDHARRRAVGRLGRSTTWPARSASICRARASTWPSARSRKTAEGTELEQGSTAILRAEPAQARARRRSASRPGQDRGRACS